MHYDVKAKKKSAWPIQNACELYKRKTNAYPLYLTASLFFLRTSFRFLTSFLADVTEFASFVMWNPGTLKHCQHTAAKV